VRYLYDIFSDINIDTSLPIHIPSAGSFL